MHILITGAAGFLGQRLARRLLAARELDVARLTLVDVVEPAQPDDPRVIAHHADLAAPGTAAQLLAPGIDAIFHLAAVVSGHAEADFPLGMRVNIDATRHLLDAARESGRCPRFIFASSVAVFSQPLPDVVREDTPPSPKSSYGMQKAVGEMLVNEYTRRGFVDGRAPRLPTISVRPGAPNRATSSFASGIIREPLDGQTATCPVDRSLVLWLSSPAAAIANLVRCLTLPASALGERRTLNLPGLSVSVEEMLAALERVAGRAAVDRVVFQPDPIARRIVSDWPGRFDVSRAEQLGFTRDQDFDAIIRAYLAEK